MAEIKPSELVVIGSGAALFVFSFMDMGGGDDNAWSEFGLITLPAIFGAFSAAAYAARAFGNVTLPDNILTLKFRQVVATLGLTATLILVGFWSLISNFDLEVKAPFWLSLIGAIGLLVGSSMDASTDAAAPSSTPPTSF